MFDWPDLDARTRQLMLEEIDADIRAGKLYIGKRLSSAGALAYPELLLQAARTGTEASLAAALRQPGFWNSRDTPRMKGRSLSVPKTPSDAAEILAEGEFNRFYMRALCQRAMEDHLDSVIVHRAKVVETPRLESEQRLGEAIDARALLEDLRQSIGGKPRHGLPEPGSGLSIRLP
ncbi:hypothetical protein SAMN05444354_11646 [Stigmatella aurantiaca]|uniref:Uncharacterized protein n=1 Tax=Stigmatella aurantiaca TaxID=41 RepID=A0A1H7Y3U9_STIAU|nr:hypothetical protein [Stigmatella aurantiaca]SEM40008.1 hypothetical protein SAMN05444354_11646 [Stigmatella aurantiaca]